MSEQRYRIMGDDSGHEYFIPTGDEETIFEAWLETFSDDHDPEFSLEYLGPDYSKNRIDGRFTFTDPRNE